MAREQGYWSADDRARYARELTIATSRVNRLEGDALAQVRNLLDDLRRETVERISWAQAKAETGGSTFDLARIGALQQEIGENFLELRARFPRELSNWSDVMAERAAAVVDGPLQVAFGTDMLPTFALSRSIVGAAATVQAGLITRMTQDGIRRVSNEIALGATGLKSPWEVMQAVGRNLDSPSIFGDIATRAEVITRTELGRVYSVASQARKEEAAKVVRGMKKQWFHGPIRSGSRPSHVAAHGQIVDVFDHYDVGGEPLRFPRDPQGSAGNTINCGCQSLPYVEGLSEELPEAA